MRKQKEEKNENDCPKLSLESLHEITKLYQNLGSLNKILAYWRCVRLDVDGNIIAILDYKNQTERNYERYSEFEPLKGIKYAGQGQITYTPFNWGSEWLSEWTKHISARAENGQSEAVLLCKTFIEKKEAKKQLLKMGEPLMW